MIFFLLLLQFFSKSIGFFYFIAIEFLKYWKPISSFTVPSTRIKEIIRQTPEEWELEKIKNESILTISGSSSNNGIIHIQVITKNQLHYSYVHILEKNQLYHGTFVSRASEDSSKIVCGPLIIELRSAFRRWRINFRGYLDGGSVSDHKSFISISGWWKSVTNVRFFYSNMNSTSLQDLINKNSWKFFKNFQFFQRWRNSTILNQMGEYHAELKIDDVISEHRYRGLRECSPLKFETESTRFSTYFEDGNALSHRFSYQNDPEYPQFSVDHGLFFKSSHNVHLIHLKNEDSLNDSNLLPIKFESPESIFEIRKSKLLTKFTFIRPDGKFVEVDAFPVNHALSNGIGFVTRIRETTIASDSVNLDFIHEYTATDSELLRPVLPFSHRACQDKILTGGKGSNLSKLQSITDGFHIPSGIVVTTAAFNQHVASNPVVQKLIRKLDVNGESPNYYENVGKIIEKEIQLTKISESLQRDILEWLPNASFYAVRSSAVGEDGADLSSAGQLESYLDVTKSDVFEKLKLCWSSNFRIEILNYRRNHGQQLNPPMAVVIQEMHRNGVAGVLFTANPVRFDRGEMVINALEGCGEQIVSGVATPDEIFIDRIHDVISVNTSNQVCCLDNEATEKLKKVGEYLESMFGKPQDIEFIVRDGRINVVQSRDITGLDRETDFEMYYELDTPLLTDKEILSNGNVGEVLPHPINALESETSCVMFDKNISCMTLREIKDVIPAQPCVGFALHHRKVFINLGEIALRIWEIVEKDRIFDTVFAGELLFNDEMFKQSAQRFGKAPKNFAIKRLFNMLKIVFYDSYNHLEAIKISSKNCENLIPSKSASAEELIEAFDKQLDHLCDAIRYHTELSVFSSFTYVICGMLIRGSDSGTLSDDNISDFANVFSNNARSDVISADVPNSLKKLATAIKSDQIADQVIQQADHQLAIEIIKNGKESGKKLEQFLKLHGHRGPKELYLDATTWEEDTTLLVHTIQSMLQCPESVEKTIENEDVIIERLRCKPTGIRRKMLKYFISQTHRGVAFRETAKNHLVHTFHSVRKTCRLLGQKLYEKGFLPDPNLWMHLNINEIKELNSTRNAKLVMRAIRRRQISSKFEGLSFPLIAHGHMNPIETPNFVGTFEKALTLKGTAVCEGKVRARARVAKTIDEAKETRHGEILITKYTDICWSPFFPIISGIVTEIGGLLSHGAVVAREYGLPSLIAVNNATNYFRTGDLVELDSIHGTISRLEDSASD